MKKLITYILLTIFTFTSNVYATEKKKEPETKKVCIVQKDSKSGKDKEVCKVMRVHKKLDGTKIPEKK